MRTLPRVAFAITATAIGLLLAATDPATDVLQLGWVAPVLMFIWCAGVAYLLVPIALELADRLGLSLPATASRGTRPYPQPSRDWMGDYNHDWYQDHLTVDRDLKGHWQRGDRTGRDYWVTGTPEWDGPWFYARGWRMPKHWRMRGAVDSTWIDFGDGLKMLGVKELG